MPVIDLPLDRLKTYQGRNPRPDDFDEYWARALDDLDRTDPAVEQAPVHHPTAIADTFDLYFTGVGGARIYAKYLRPVDIAPSSPGIVHFHGYSMSSADWFDLIPYVAQGYSVLAMDCRGQGGRSEDLGGVPGNTHSGHIIRGLAGSPTDLLYRSIFLDCVQAVRVLAAAPEVDQTRIAVVGASQGGGLALACAALADQVVAAASIYPFLCDYQRVWELDLGKDAYAEIREYLRRFDPTHDRVASMFTTLGYIDAQHLAARIDARVLMITGLMDEVCPPSTQFAAFNKLRGAKEHVIYPDFGHELLPGAGDRILAFFDDALAVR